MSAVRSDAKVVYFVFKAPSGKVVVSAGTHSTSEDGGAVWEPPLTSEGASIEFNTLYDAWWYALSEDGDEKWSVHITDDFSEEEINEVLCC